MSTQELKYRAVYNWVLDNINSGALKVGEKLPSENELSERFGLSRQTVRHAVDILEQQKLVLRVRGSGTYVGGNGKAERQERYMNIAVISTYVDSYIFPPVDVYKRQMLDMQTGEFTQAKGQEVMESFLKSYDDIDVVVAENDNMAFGAIDAIKAAGKTCGPDGDIIIFSFDAVKAAFDAMIAGDLNAAFECNPLHGPRVDEIIKKLEKGETVEKIQYVDEAYFDTSMDLESIKAERAY